MGTVLGSAKRRAAQLGITVEDYQRIRASGMHWCCPHKAWHPVSDFPRSRWHSRGLAHQCKAYKRLIRTDPVEPPDKCRARRLVEQRVRRGTMPHPNTLACTDCGGRWEPGKPRHEYDHYLGYDRAHAADVQAVCLSCHTDRSVVRGERRRKLAA